MAGRIEVVRPGDEAENALAGATRAAQAGDPLAPVTVVVRSGLVGFGLRRGLAERGPFAGPRFVRMSRLIELLAAPEMGTTAVGERPLSPVSLAAAVRVVLGQRPGAFGPVADHRTTEESLVRAYRSLRPLSQDELDRLTAESDRAGDVVAIVREVRSLLAGVRYDLEDLTLAARSGLAAGDVDLEAVGSVIVYLPDPMPAAQIALLGALSDAGDVAVLVGGVGDPVADRAGVWLTDELVALGFEPAESRAQASSPEHVEGDRSATAGAAAAGVGFDEAWGAPDFEEEVRMAVRFLAAQAEAGRPLGRAAVAVPSSVAGQAYLGALAEQLRAAGIPWSGPTWGRIADLPSGRLVLDLIELMTDFERPFDRNAVIGWLGSPGLSVSAHLFDDLSFSSEEGSGEVPIGEFDRSSRRAGVVWGIDEWDQRLETYIADVVRRAEVWGDGAEHGAVPRSALAATELRTIVRRLSELAGGLADASSWNDVTNLVGNLLGTVIPPGQDQRLLGSAMESLAELEDLEPLAAETGNDPAGGSRRSRQLASAFAGALSGPAGDAGRFGVGPVVGRVADLAGLRTELLIVLGCREGVLPARTPDDPLVTDLEREAVSVLAARERVEHRDRRAMLSCLAGADRSIAVYSRVDRGASRIAHPSRWLLGDLFRGSIREVASFSAASLLVAEAVLPPADSTDLELALLSGTVASDGCLEAGESVVARIDDVGRRVAAERERGGIGLTRFGGFVGPRPDNTTVVDGIVSPTRIERLGICPLRFMFERVVKVDILEAPDRLDTISAMDRGSLIHEVLDRFVNETAVERVDFTGWDGADLDRLHEIAAEEFQRAEQSGITGKPLYWRLEKAQVLADLDRFIELEGLRLAESGGRPERTEHSFGDGDVPPVSVSLPAAELKFRGKIDRIDVEPDGVVRVIDYKSGSSNSYKSISRRPLGGGRHLQLPIYAKAAQALVGEGARSVVAEYRFCSASGGFATMPVTLTPELDASLSHVLGVLADTIDAGAFPPRPGSGDDQHQENCRYCDYASICRLDRGALWERAVADPRVGAYVTLVEGDSDAPPDSAGRDPERPVALGSPAPGTGPQPALFDVETS